jgi:uncharacterized protein YacL
MSLGLPKHFAVDLIHPIRFTWDRTTDSGGKVRPYRHCIWGANERFTLDKCKEVAQGPLASPRGRLYAALLALLITLLVVVLALTAMKHKRGPLLALAVLFFGAVLLAYFFVGRDTMLSETMTRLESGKSYFWKVVAEDDGGALAESETRRLAVK